MQGENVKDNFNIKEIIGYAVDRNDFFNTYKIKDIIMYYKLPYKNFDEERFHDINKIFEIPLKKKLQANGALFIEELDLTLEDMLVYSVEK